jgi:hypothetical protein
MLPEKSPSAQSIPNRKPPSPELITRRRAHRLRACPLNLISAKEPLRLLVGAQLQRTFPFTLGPKFLDVFVLDVAVEVSPVAFRVIRRVFGVEVVVYVEFGGSVVLGVGRGFVEARVWVCGCAAGEEGGEQGDDEEEEEREEGLQCGHWGGWGLVGVVVWPSSGTVAAHLVYSHARAAAHVEDEAVSAAC